jgi:hypothetical protein
MNKSSANCVALRLCEIVWAKAVTCRRARSEVTTARDCMVIFLLVTIMVCMSDGVVEEIDAYCASHQHFSSSKMRIRP